MFRKIIRIDEEKCTGCGKCAEACHEGAIGMVNGKARLLRDDYCDGLGDCLPACPAGAIGFETREASAYDESAVQENKRNRQDGSSCSCPGTQPKAVRHDSAGQAAASDRSEPISRLAQWPVQIKLAPVKAPYFADANLLIAADCTAYARGDFHSRFMKNRITLIGCPKLDDGDYGDKLTAILKNNEIKSVTIVRMEVPCCGGIENAVKRALQSSGKFLPWQVVTVAADGRILE
ncbi:ATP-binding protein [Papillibacter cinnamivorans]|uniref:4Fe-4S dicluster domain-containing protein n=1 Tax=Papillibacter cinnamivorans DSM 12816 TaxID=1122930 RepID=A0A1W2ASC8_9FIRM|nr:4Fe-4S binding protein [Papillibacter cinnamivorans]SMC63616.1 4Fe-4S dicluster domain-containing protein [Papillibacter cinnamivorans DSM 12816]